IKEIDVQHPAAKMMVEISKTVDNEVGDGTTSSVVFGGSLLAKAEELMEKDVHATVIIEGFQTAQEKALSLLEKLAKKVSLKERDIILNDEKTKKDEDEYRN